MRDIAAVILAAGEGRRMGASIPKVCCEVLFKPLIRHVTDNIASAGIGTQKLCVVVAPGQPGEMVRSMLPDGCRSVVQQERMGTGHALMQCMDFLREHERCDILVTYGDAPFVDANTICAAHAAHVSAGSSVTVVTARVSDPARYGRIVRTDGGVRIVEAADATDEQLMIDEINAGTYWFSAGFLIENLRRLTTDNKLGQYYLTDMLGFCDGKGTKSGAFMADCADVVLGANTRRELARLCEIARSRVVGELLDAGVDIPFANQVVVGLDVKVAPGACLMPGTILKGLTSVGAGAVIGPNSVIESSIIGSGSTIAQSQIADSEVGRWCKIGPFAQLRPGSRVGDGVKIGNFVEVKNASVGDKTSLAHLSYLGDIDIGSEVNVGCGVVIVNYDGRNKHRSAIGDSAFIGCNTNIISPAKVGRGAYVAAATTVTQDVPDSALAIGRARQENKPGGAQGRFKGKSGK